MNDTGVEQWGDPGAGGNGSELAEGLLSLLDASRSQVQAVLEQLTPDGAMIPAEAFSTFSMAEEAASEAHALMESGMYEEAADRATEALQLYGEVMLMILDSNYGTQEIVTEDDSTNLQELWATLERSYAYLREVNATFHKMKESGVDVANVEEFIRAVERCLAQAEEFLQQGDSEGAEGALESAFKCLDGAMTYMQSLNEGLTVKKAEVFLAKSERRFERLEGDILDLVDPGSFEPEDLDVVQQTLEDATLKNRELKDLLAEGDMSTVKGELEGFKKYSEDVFGILDKGDKELAKELRKAYKSEVKLSMHEDNKNSNNLEGTSSDPDPDASLDPVDWDSESLEVTSSDTDPDASQDPEGGDPKEESEPNDVAGDGETQPEEPIKYAPGDSWSD